MKAFHGSQEMKAALLTKLRAHAQADHIVKGQYWENGKGCAVGCTIESSDHSLYESRFGIPQMLARFEDAIFEGLPNELAMTWPIRFIEAVPLGKDLLNVQWQMLVLIVQDCNPVPSPATQEVLDILDALGRGEAVCQQRKEIASYTARAAARAASYAARAVARSASWAARSASWAARSAVDFWKRASEKLSELYNASQIISNKQHVPVVFESGAIRSNCGKTRWDLLPYDSLEIVAQVMTQGADKYGDRNWEKGFPWMSVFSSLMRHLFKWVRGEDLDDESGLPHLSHAACNVLFLLTFHLRKSGTDDRMN